MNEDSELGKALGETNPAPDTESWKYAAEGEDFDVRERRVANRFLEAYADRDGEGFYLGHLRAVVAAAGDYGDDAFVRVAQVTPYGADDGRGEHWFNGIVIQETMASRRTDLLGGALRTRG